MAKNRARNRNLRRGPGRRTYAARPWLAELLGDPEQSLWRQTLGWLVRLRAELTTLFAVFTGHLVLVHQFTLTHGQVVVTETVIVMVALAIPGTRRSLTSRVWAVLDRHRMRVCFTQTRTMTPAGSLPYLLWSSPTPVGERIRVWLRAGLSVNDLEQISDELASACFAAATRVTVSPKVATYVVIDVIRRDPLTGKRLTRGTVTDALPATTTTSGARDPYAFAGKLTPTEIDAYQAALGNNLSNLTNSDSSDSVRPLPDRATLPAPTAPVAEPTSGNTPAARKNNQSPRSTARSSPTQSTNPPAVVGVDGTDVSDYV